MLCLRGWPAIAKVCHRKDPRVRVKFRTFAMADLRDGGLESVWDGDVRLRCGLFVCPGNCISGCMPWSLWRLCCYWLLRRCEQVGNPSSHSGKPRNSDLTCQLMIRPAISSLVHSPGTRQVTDKWVYRLVNAPDKPETKLDNFVTSIEV